MNVLADLHHSDLYFSLHLLFEKRLGWNLYRPIGEEWFEKGFWKIAEPYNNQPATIQQFLGLNRPFYPPDETVPLNLIDYIRDNIYYIRGLSSGTHHKAVTFQTFCDMDFDIVIASIPAHYQAYSELIQKYKPKAKLICQVGNIGWARALDYTYVKNLMASTSPLPVPPGINTVYYHQEFDLDIFRYLPPTPGKNIYCFMNCLKETQDYPFWEKMKGLMPSWNFRSFGAQCDDGCLTPHTAIAAKMQEANFVWHLKTEGDGFGHVLHNAYACGRPTIIKKHYYQGLLGEALLTHEATCIDVDQTQSKDHLKDMIEYWARPENHYTMCENAYQRFRQIVNYDQELEEIKKFLSRLV